MRENIIFHNARCSKSRQTLSLLESKHIEINVVDYQEFPPTEQEIRYICQKLGISPRNLVRRNDPKFKNLDICDTDLHSETEWVQLICTHPEILERPIVIYNGKVALGRPPENVLNIISQNP